MRTNIVQLKASITEAKARHDEAAKDVKLIERDMNEFSNNKDSKLAELQASMDKLRKSLTKSSAAIKPLQLEARESKLEVEQCGTDLAGAQESLEETDGVLTTQKDEIAGLTSDYERLKVCERVQHIF